DAQRVAPAPPRVRRDLGVCRARARRPRRCRRRGRPRRLARFRRRRRRDVVMAVPARCDAGRARRHADPSGPATVTFSSRYRTIARLPPRPAFAPPAAQAGIADLERRMFRRELDAFDVGPPVLITALPRAGTTILLELLAATPELASHTYRDMPFLLC